MTANNEVGTLASISEIGGIARDHGILFHTDAAQAVGHIPTNIDTMKIDLMSFSSRKIYGPKGIGVLLQIRAPATLLVRPADLDVSVTDDKLEMSRIAQHLQDGFWYVAVTGPPVLVAYH